MLRLFQRQAPEQAAHIEIAHDGETYRIALKRVATSRRFTLRVRTATRDALLTMPSRSSLKAAREFAERHAAWIGTRLARLPEPVAFAPRAVTPLRGVDHRIVHRPGERGGVWLEASESGPLICVSGERPHVARRDHRLPQARGAQGPRSRGRAALEAARRQAAPDRAARYCQPLGLVLVDRGPEFFLAPDSRAAFVLDYLAAHEVAHIVHMNHSPQFWKLARRLHPGTDRAEVWLKLYGANLHRYGATWE